MLLRETGFTFNGMHSRRDMGLIYVEKDGHIAIPEIKRNSYAIAGMSGTLLLPGEDWRPFTLEGTLYPADEPAMQAQAQALIRNVAAWLTAGRQPLIFDYEPEVYYLAELSAACKWSLKNWFGGELQVRWTAQPFAYNVEADTVTVDITSAGETNITLRVETGRPAPLKLTVRNPGEAAITGVSVGGIVLEGFNLRNARLDIDSEPPAGAMIGVRSAMPYATHFAPVMLENGANTLAVGITFSGDGARQARVTASARGRW